MAYRNRVWPDGSVRAEPVRGTVMGNRGGRIHDIETKEIIRTQASRRWICCVLAFKGRRRQVMGRGYTELFFLDEVTALAAGHRPCFECRREAARSFATLASQAPGMRGRSDADALDRALAAERGAGRGAGRGTRLQVDLRHASGRLPAGTLLQQGDAFLAISAKGLLRWSASGYAPATAGGTDGASGLAEVLTPPLTRHVLAAGYQPIWHASAGDASAS
ncbi:hypothetical protein GWI71_12555 [Microvirga tunisiensis]|uniref:Hedgehog/Intein (Hint) domain-containing protein n=1 Tax=Pannonibacter tanglangensis TaxID=2750084 RepID=A0ABW9ZIH7_9HYPH|nr:hypothetical protein [Pannonibacter sp. XCT-34]